MIGAAERPQRKLGAVGERLEASRGWVGANRRLQRLSDKLAWGANAGMTLMQMESP